MSSIDFKTLFNFGGQVAGEIHIQCNAYRPETDTIVLGLNQSFHSIIKQGVIPGIRCLDSAQRQDDLLRIDCGLGAVELLYSGTWNDREIYKLPDLGQFLFFTRQIAALGLINAAQRQEIEQRALEIEQVLRNRTLLQDSPATKMQEDVLKDLVIPYLEPLMEFLPNPELLPRFIFALTRKFQFFFNTFLAETSPALEKERVSEALELQQIIARICLGQENCISMLKQLGPAAPMLSTQGAIIIDLIATLTQKKFSNLGATAYQQFYVVYALRLLSHNLDANLNRNISRNYSLSFGFPQEHRLNPFNSQIDTAHICTYSEEEKAVLQQFGLRRLPVSEADFEKARATIPGELTENYQALLCELDGSLYPQHWPPFEQLRLAVIEKDIGGVQELLQAHKMDLNTPSESGSAYFNKGDIPLHVIFAMHHLDPKIGLFLLETNRDAINQQESERGDTLLHLLAYKNNLLMVRALLERGALILGDNISGRTPIHTLICSRGTYPYQINPSQLQETLSLLRAQALKQGLPDLDQLVDQEGRNPLHLAAMNANRPGILALVALGMNVDLMDHHGSRPIDFLSPEHNNPLRKDLEVIARLTPALRAAAAP